MLRKISIRHVFLSVLGLSVLTLAVVLISEYGFGLKPCELCIFQRVPYVFLIVFALAGLFLAKRPQASRILLLLITLTFVASAGLGIYHAGVEKKIFPGPTACSQQTSDKPLSIEELKLQIMQAPVVACSEPAWQWNGITMAGMNAIFSLMMSGLMGWCYIRRGRLCT